MIYFIDNKIILKRPRVNQLLESFTTQLIIIQYQAEKFNYQRGQLLYAL